MKLHLNNYWKTLPLITGILLSTTTTYAGPAVVTTNKLVNRFMHLDHNGDGVSFDEFMRMIESRARKEYAQMDSNKDGRVSAYEYKRFWKQRKAKYYRVKR